MHKAETILATLATLLTSMTTVGDVTRARTWPVHQEPALTVRKGADLAEEDDDAELGAQVRRLTVFVDIHLVDTGNLETGLHEIAAELYRLMMADDTLGLINVFAVEFVGDLEPELESSQDIPLARMVTEWEIVYQHSLRDTEL